MDTQMMVWNRWLLLNIPFVSITFREQINKYLKPRPKVVCLFLLVLFVGHNHFCWTLERFKVKINSALPPTVIKANMSRQGLQVIMEH